MDHSEIKHLPKVDHTPAVLDEPSKLLLKAAELIEERGLAKFTRCDDQGRLCYYGALSIAASGAPWSVYRGDRPRAGNAFDAADQRMIAATGYYDPADWNNKEERTQDEVVAKLRAVALGL